LGGVASSTYNAHVISADHLTQAQRDIISGVLNSRILAGVGSEFTATQAAFDAAVITGGLKIYQYIDSNYTPNVNKYVVGIDTSKVLQPSSIIDGGTY